MKSLPTAKKSLRRRRSVSEAEDLAAAWRASGESQTKWRRSHEVLKTTLPSCLDRVQRSESVAVCPSLSGFIAVHPPKAVEEAPCEVRIELGGGAQILGLDVDGVIAVLRGLRESSR
jgi:hypothetical protein